MALPAPHRFTIEEYHQMGRAGVLDPDARTELIEGEVLEMAPIASRHAGCVNRLNQFFSIGVGDRALVGVQNPMALWPFSEPQPDLTVMKPRRDYYTIGHPCPEDLLLVVEVADTTLPFDRNRKLPLYARHEVAEVWLVDIPGRAVEVHTEPGPDGYATVRRLTGDDTVAPGALPDLVLAVGSLFPPA